MQVLVLTLLTFKKGKVNFWTPCMIWLIFFFFFFFFCYVLFCFVFVVVFTYHNEIYDSILISFISWFLLIITAVLNILVPC